MFQRHVLIIVTTLALAGCAVPTSQDEEGSKIGNVPDAVAALAAPDQDLTTARLLEDDCYWYRHSGPVEDTLVPLRTTGGNPICVSRAT